MNTRLTKNRIVLIGPPGSGKGTQAQRLTKEYNLPHLSSGDILRAEVSAGTEFGKKIQHFMESGEIGPAELITEIVLRHISGKCKAGYILDGFPRTLYQAEELDKWQAPDIAIFIDVPEDIIVERICGRRTCPLCSAIYHVKYNPPLKENVCGKCGAALTQRKDDNEATVKNRIRVYKEETMPVINFYRDKGILNNINGNIEPDMLYKKITDLIK
ncbi:MAG: adenylate kinase [Spirochaetes bacterium]|nr:adenylate kinase [Spirochaetota bacterium]